MVTREGWWWYRTLMRWESREHWATWSDAACNVISWAVVWNVG